jgi:CheY-like chemotaxis protein
MNRSAFSPSISVVEEAGLADDEAPLRILLAEDDREMRRLLSLILHRDGHEIVETRDAGELLEALASTLIEPGPRPFDLIVCEQSLPGIPGLTVLAGLRSRGCSTPFVLITGDEAVGEHARRLDGIVLDHPFNVEAIRLAIRRCFPPGEAARRAGS